MREALIQQRQDRVARYRLLKQHQAASDPERREEIREKIHRLVGRMFDTDQTLKEYKVEQLTRELDALKRDLADRVARRDDLIDQTVQRLLDSPIPDRPHTRPGR
jgi:polyhydroxyalkanoate synthesis regulator phasin